MTRELVEELTKPLSIIYQQPWLTRKVPDDWNLDNLMLIHKKNWKEDPGNLNPDKIMEEIILSAITQHLQDGQGNQTQPAQI